MSIDAYLDDYASERISDGKGYRWWWNGCDILADAIASLTRHVRLDGCHLLTEIEKDELEKIERYMRYMTSFSHPDAISGEQANWLHAEAMWLLGQWFTRLWD